MCTYVFAHRREKRERITMNLNTTVMENETTFLSSANIKLEANPFKKSLITMKSAEVNESL